MSAKIKTGIVGFGYMGEIRYRNIMEHPDMELAGICDPNREAEIKAKGAHVFATWQEMIDGDVDAVIICTPNFGSSQ